MRRSNRARAALRVVSWVGLAGCAGCALASGLDKLQKVECLDTCADASIPLDAAMTFDAKAESGPDAGSDGGPTRQDAEAGRSPEDAGALDVVDAPLEGGDAALSSPLARVQVIVPGWQAAAQVTVGLGEGAGNLLVAGVYGINSTDTFSVTDSLGNTWKKTTPQMNLATGCQSNGQGTVVQIFYAEAIMGGSNTVTVQQSGTVALGAIVIEYAGVRGTNAFDVVSGAIATSSASRMTAGMVTTTGPIDLVVALFADAQNGSGIMATGPGFAGATDTGFYSLIEDDLPGTTPQSITPTATQPDVGQPNCWAATTAAFKAE